MLQEILMKWLVTTGCHKLPVILFLLVVVVLVKEAVARSTEIVNVEIHITKNLYSFFVKSEVNWRKTQHGRLLHLFETAKLKKKKRLKFKAYPTVGEIRS